MERLAKRIWILIVLLHGGFTYGAGSRSGSGQYPASDIPDSLKLNANAVVREYLFDFNFKSPSKTSTHHRVVVTVLNNSGDSYAEFHGFYDRFRKLTFIKGYIYNASGQMIKKIKNMEIQDYSNTSESSLYEDNRIKYYQPLVSRYPYTVEYEYEYTISGSFVFPRWMPVWSYNLSVQRSEFKAVFPAGYLFRYKESNLHNKLSVTQDGTETTYTWAVNNIMAYEREPFSPSLNRISPVVYTAPSDFEIDGYYGNMETWEKFGQWQNKLNEGRDKLPLATLERMRGMVRGVTDDKEKVRIIYKYLQSKTRYVSIQLGIGGWQPFEASVVDEVGYGDCKALSNYAKALLKAAGIQAYYTLVTSGNSFPQLIRDFPSNQFDHVILCVPLKKDTIWLECTSQIVPFGFLGDFTSDRDVLIMKENGGDVVRTKAYSLNDNFQVTYAKVHLAYDGNAKSSISRLYGGLRFSRVISFADAGNEEQKNWIYKEIHIPNYHLLTFALSHDTTDKSLANLSLNLELTNYASISGKRMFLPLNLMSHSEFIPAKTRERKQEIIVHVSSVDYDTIEYMLPPNVTIEFIPEPVEIITPFGEYSSCVKVGEKSIFYMREFRFYKGAYPAENYPAFIRFFQDAANADNEKLVLIKAAY